MQQISSNIQAPLSIKTVGAALSATLVALYVACWLSVIFLPMLPLSHTWLSLFTAAWPMSIAGLAQGVLMNVVIAWIAGAVYVSTYNRTIRHRR